VRVLLVVHDFLPANRAGAELYTYYLARELARSGVEVELFFSEGSPTRRVERRLYDGLPCTVVFKPRGNPFDVLAGPDGFVDDAFRDCLDRVQPDIVHVNHLLFLSLMLPAIAKSRGIPVVFTLHDYWLSCPRVTRLDHHERPCTSMTPIKCTVCCRELYSRFSPARRPGPVGAARLGARRAYTVGVEFPAAYSAFRRRNRQIRALTKTVDFWIAPSRFLRDLMSEFGLPGERILHVPNGLPTTHLEITGRPERGGRLHFGYLGTIHRHKGIHVLLEAFRGVDAADLTIWGGAPGYVEAEYRDVLAQSNVRFPGLIEDEQKASVFSSIDALVVPSIWFENAPLVILEALLSGVPVIASDIGGMKELIRDGETGFHFAAGSVRDLRRLLLSCIQDPSRLRRLKPSSLTVTSMEEHARTILSVYGRMLPAPVR
jgi:glycosyltransferase involved in cell wall biosynthesis